MEERHGSTKAGSCDNENAAIVTHQQVLELWKEDEQLRRRRRRHPIHKWDVPRKSEKERTNEKRKWKTADNCSEKGTWPDVRLVLYFPPSSQNKNKNNDKKILTRHLWWLFVFHTMSATVPLFASSLFSLVLFPHGFWVDDPRWLR